MAEVNPSDPKQQEAHAKGVKEKAAREARPPVIQSWPMDAEGNPMAIVIGTVSDLVPTVAFGNVNVGPVQIMRPVKNTTIDEIIIEATKVQQAVEFICATERRIIQWSMDPSSRLERPVQDGGTQTVDQVAPPPPAS